MYNNFKASNQKRNVHNIEDEPPEKKLVSDGDMLIKQLVEKQTSTKVNLHEQLAAKSQFYKSTEVLSVTNYTSGFLSLEKFNWVLEHLNDVEKLKSYGLSNEEIELLHACQGGNEVIKEKHKNLNSCILNSKLEEIHRKIKDFSQHKNEVVKKNRLTTETTLATKPTSLETKLLKFALDNKQKSIETLPGPMDHIKDLEKELVKNLAPVDIKKIRKKARSLAKQIENIGNSALKEPVSKEHRPNSTTFCSKTQWDVKECCRESHIPKDSKVFTCKPQNYYTIKDGIIVKINSPESSTDDKREEQKKLCVDEIKKIPKFENYDKGIPSKILYLKNLANGVQENTLESVFTDFRKCISSVKIMKGKMRGQAFIEFIDEKAAEKALDDLNGTILKNKPIIIQFGRWKQS